MNIEDQLDAFCKHLREKLGSVRTDWYSDAAFGTYVIKITCSYTKCTKSINLDKFSLIDDKRLDSYLQHLAKHLIDDVTHQRGKWLNDQLKSGYFVSKIDSYAPEYRYTISEKDLIKEPPPSKPKKPVSKYKDIKDYGMF